MSTEDLARRGREILEANRETVTLSHRVLQQINEGRVGPEVKALGMAQGFIEFVSHAGHKRPELLALMQRVIQSCIEPGIKLHEAKFLQDAIDFLEACKKEE